LALAGAWRREGLAPALLLAGAGACATLYTWPDIKSVVIDAELNVRRFTGDALGPAGPPFLTSCALFAALFGAGGYLTGPGARVQGPYAAVSAGAPVIILAIAYWRVVGVDHDARWALGALLLAGLFTFAVERAMRRAGDGEPRPGVIAAYALAASAAAAMAVGMALEQLWMSLGFALQAAAAAWLWRRFGIPALKLTAVIFAALATARLTVFGEVFDYELGSVPVFNWLLWGYGVSAIALWRGAQWFEGGGLARGSAVVQSLEAGSLILIVSLVSLQIRHALNGGDLLASYDTLLEVGLQSSAWLAIALAVRWRLGPHLHFTPRWTERVLLVLGLVQVALAHFITMNPWWGVSPVAVEGPALFNALLAAYAAPGLIAAAYAFIARRQGARLFGTLAGLTGAALLWAWTTLEVRRAFHHPWLTPTTNDIQPGAGPVGDGESYAFSAVWVAYAAALLGLGFLRRRPSLRYAALALLTATTLKVFLIDMAALEGVLRGLSFIGLGAALMAIAVLYQRVILPATRREAAAGGPAVV
ncbi:MAG: DUF2339 domain-containing protein, partial [Caulobacterales bacterium]|nr:DUF2339 domain-containing protein [Caulobacterales bacterium]